MKDAIFQWDEEKNKDNQKKHGLSFEFAQRAFSDHRRVIVEDMSHSDREDRFYCIGQVDEGIVTVRLTHRNGTIRIIGAGYWRKRKKIYEEKNTIHK